LNQHQLSLHKKQLQKKKSSPITKRSHTKLSSRTRFRNSHKKTQWLQLQMIMRNFKDHQKVTPKPWQTRSLIRLRERREQLTIFRNLRVKRRVLFKSFNNLRPNLKLKMLKTKKCSTPNGINSVWTLKKLISIKLTKCGPNITKKEPISHLFKSEPWNFTKKHSNSKALLKTKASKTRSKTSISLKQI